MKILAASDFHLYNKNPKFRISADGKSDLLAAQEKYLNHLLEVLTKDNYSAFLFLGDYTDSAYLDPMTLEVAVNFLARVNELSIPAIFLEGNHCMEDSKMRYSVLGSFSKVFQNIRFVTEPAVINLSEMLTDFDYGPPITAYVAPYMGDFNKCRNLVREFNDSIAPKREPGGHYNFLLFHFPLVGASTDTGFKTERGVYLEDEDVSNFDFVLGGDFHKPQRLNFKTCKNAYYVGAPFVLTMNEQTERGFLSIEIDENTKNSHVEIVQNPFCYAMHTVEYSNLQEYLKKEKANLHKTILKVTSVPKEDIKHVESIRAKLYNLFIMVENKDNPIVIKRNETEKDSYKDLVSGYLNQESEEVKEICLKMVDRLERLL